MPKDANPMFDPLNIVADLLTDGAERLLHGLRRKARKRRDEDRGSPETPDRTRTLTDSSEHAQAGTQQPRRRPWWRRVFGG